MKAEFKSSEWRDFTQRYHNTYGWFEREGKPSLLVNVAEVNEERMVFIDKQGMKYTALADKGNIFSFIPVIRGMYKCKGEVTYILRTAARQYKRGICQDNTSIVSLYQGSQFLDFKIIEDMLNTNVQEDIAKFKGGLRDNVLLSNQFSIVGGQVYLYNDVIGKIAKEHVELTSPLFMQEITDIFRANNIDMEVVS